MMHESDTVSALLVIHINRVTLILKPFNLVSSDAVHAPGAHAIASARTKEPKTSVILILLDFVLDWNLVGELMVHLMAVEVVEVWQGCRILMLTFQLLHRVRSNISLEVMIAWYHAPWDFKIFQSKGQFLVVSFPESWLLAIPSLTADDISSDGDEVRFFFRD